MKENYSHAELQKLAKERLWPSLTNPSYLVQRRRRQILQKWIGTIPGTRLSVLDIGGRYQPYRPLFGGRVANYVALDVLPTRLVSVVGDGQKLPFKSESFDMVIATGVFEYFAEPRRAAEEVHRVLKTGGHLMLSVASIYPRVVDDEHWRFLPAGLKFVLAPFARVTIVPEVASVGGFFRMMATSIIIFAKYDSLREFFRYTAIPLMNLAGLALDRNSISNNDQIAGNYCALAEK
ncbi:MAG TPA: class I SAM-dependent methyltransferase [Verrucomicrobiae bacterium]|nr:class I SAM-dependent methyltransferase [Verrucomicrobiae bacterium]